MTDFYCKAVLFDLDGTLVDSWDSVLTCWRSWAERCGLDPQQVLEQIHGRRAVDIISLMAPERSLEEEEAWMLNREIEESRGLKAIPGAAELLAQLPPDRWAVVTSAVEDLARARLGAAGLPVPPVLVPADQIANGKPAPDGYREAARRLGLDPSECLIVEDAPVGVKSALGAGGQVLALLTSHPRGELPGAAAYAPNLAGLQAALDGHGRLRITVP